MAGEQRGQRDQLDAVDGGAAQRLIARGDAERGAAQVHVGAADVEVGTATVKAWARVADSGERASIWATQKERMPNFADYEKSAAPREIPVILLDPEA